MKKSNPRLLSSWLEAKTAALEVTESPENRSSDIATDLTGLALRAALRPGLDPALLAKSFTALVEAAKKSEDLTQVKALLTDARQPGWIHLAAALVVGDVDAVCTHARHTVALTERTEIGYIKSDPDAFAALSPVRRLRLAVAHVLAPWEAIAPSEVSEVVDQVARTSWSEALGELHRHVSWKGTDLPRCLSVVASLASRLSLENHVRTAFAAIGAHEALSPAHPHHELALEVALKLLGMPEVDPTWAGPGVSSPDDYGLAMRLAASPQLGARRLAALLSRHGRTKDIPVSLLRLLGSNPDSAWALPEITSYHEPSNILAVLDSVLNWAPASDPLVLALLVNLPRSATKNWLKDAAGLHARLGKTGIALSALAALQISPNHGYGSRQAMELVQDLPGSIKAELVSLSAREVNAVLGSSKELRVNDMELDQARAELVESGWYPSTGRVPAHCTAALTKTLRDLSLGEARNEVNAAGARDGAGQVIEAWLRALPAAEAVRLIQEMEDYIKRCSAGDSMPPSARRVLDSALEAASTPSAQAALVEAIRRTVEAPYDSPLSMNHTLTGYALTLKAVSERA